MDIHIWRATGTVLFFSKTWTICRELSPKQKWCKVKMPFGHYSVPHKEWLHFRQSKWNVYIKFLLLPHLTHLGSLLINLREAKSETFTTSSSLLPQGIALRNRMETTKDPWLPKSYFQQIAKRWQYAYFHASSLPAARAVYRLGSALCPSWPGHPLCAKGRPSSAAGTAPCSSWAALPGHAAGPATLPCPRATLLSRTNWNNKFAALALALLKQSFVFLSTW